MEKIREELQKTDIAGILSDMIKIPSFSFMEEQEKEIARYIKDFFDKEEIPCQIYEIEPGRYNVTAVIRGAGGGRSLSLIHIFADYADGGGSQRSVCFLQAKVVDSHGSGSPYHGDEAFGHHHVVECHASLTLALHGT